MRVTSDVLTRIVRDKKEELQETMRRRPVSELLRRVRDTAAPPAFCAAITKPEINIIAEIKYKSPSHGAFACQLPPQDISRIYAESGASAVSVLTEQNYFGGNIEFLQNIRASLSIPLLRKDFIVDDYQVVEARAYGASAYLLIVACLCKSEVYDLIEYGKEFRLDALVEVHDPFELEIAVESGAKMIGVNNRNLNTFKVSINTSFEIAKRMEKETGYVLVSESGISEYGQIKDLRDAGFSAFLIGETLMNAADPGKTLRELRGQADGLTS